MTLATGGYKSNVCIINFTKARFAIKPTTATDIKRMNCLDGFDLDSVNTR